MKILRSGSSKNPKPLRGKCQCGCKVECELSETKTLVDRDTQPGMATQYVTCPECKNRLLWVK